MRVEHMSHRPAKNTYHHIHSNLFGKPCNVATD